MPESPRRFVPPHPLVAVLIVASIATIIGLHTIEPTSVRSPLNPEHQPWPLTGRYHQRLAMPLDLPAMAPISIAASAHRVPRPIDSLDPRQAVVGIVREGLAVAIPLIALSGPMSHVAILEFPNSQVAVTHCDLSGCTRVLRLPTSPPHPVPTQPQNPTATRSRLELKVGGLERDGGLVLLWDGVRYSHQSPALPLADEAFVITDLGCWQAQHPTTQIVFPRPGSNRY